MHDPLVATTHALHAVAEQVLAADLHRHTGRIGLRATPGGFGTPWFDADGVRRQVRVEGTDLVVDEDGSHERRAPLTTVRAVAELAGVEPGAPADVYPPVMPFEPDAPLDIDAAAAARVAEWFALVDDALRSFAERHAADEPSPAQLWPEHFDLAISMDAANYGGSPPDDDHAIPYLYVGPWTPRTGDFWTEPFGASEPQRDGTTADDAVAFFEDGWRRLAHDPAA